MTAKTHVGYYLIGAGARAFEAELHLRLTTMERVRRYVAEHASPIYQFTIGILVSIPTVGVLAFSAGNRLAWPWQAVVVAAGASLGMYYASKLVRSLLLGVSGTRALPKLNKEEGTSRGYRTLVAVPALLPSPERARELIQRLVDLANGNPDMGLRFALLADFVDADTQTAPEDARILETTKSIIDELNARTRDSIGDRFFVLQRKRSWSESQQAWIGWERKRGKLLELNRLLADRNSTTTFGWIFGDLQGLRSRASFAYVISLDENTWLENEGARELLRTAAHPLNQPSFDECTGRLNSGYAILQPSVVFVAPTARGSDEVPVHERTLPGQSRNFRASFYFDALGVGVHKGAGALYDVAACRRLLDGTFPDDRVLQHDLLDGFVARTGEVRDAFVVQPWPRSYLVQLQRGHRWLRGITQALPWVLPWVRDGRATIRANPLAVSQRFFIAELVLVELRRAASLAMLICAWTVLPGPAILWTVVVCPPLAFILASPLSLIVRESTRIVQGGITGASRHSRHASPALLRDAVVRLFSIVMLPYEGALVLDALLRGLWRMIVSRRHLLDWTTHRALDVGHLSGIREYWRLLWLCPTLGIATLIIVGVIRPSSLLIAAPFALGWILAPWILWHADRLVFGS